MAILSAILAGLKALGALLGLIQTETERQAGRNEVNSADAQALAKAEGEVATIATEGRTDAETVGALKSGEF